jgi:hypothetical protein
MAELLGRCAALDMGRMEHTMIQQDPECPKCASNHMVLTNPLAGGAQYVCDVDADIADRVTTFEYEMHG